ncbi:MAG TPA: polymer-forming cytoskeletal protein [Thermoanaerobaculia bacterium]|nr:polymer-forming cytoskeletal protein [Thermoanaerobaculia bacterium]
MALFRRDDRRSTPPARPPVTGVVRETPAPPARAAAVHPTRIGPGLVVVGRVRGAGAVEIAGRVEGAVEVAGTVVVAPGGTVVGDAGGRVVVVAGRVEGRVVAAERAELAGTAHVEGDVEAPRVAIAEGAYLKGSVRMGGDGRQAAAAGESS